MIEQLEEMIKAPVIEDTVSIFDNTLMAPTFFRKKKALSRAMSGDTSKGGLITLLKNGDEDIYKIDHEKNKQPEWERAMFSLA